MKPFTVIVLPRAQREIDEAAQWWAEHGSPTAIDDAIARVLKRLERFPRSAPRVQIEGAWSTTRRAAEDPIGYHLYYRVNLRARTIVVRCFWNQKRPGPYHL